MTGSIEQISKAEMLFMTRKEAKDRFGISRNQYDKVKSEYKRYILG